MSRSVLPFAASDISSLARSLKNQLDKLERLPGHVELLNMLAKSTGFQNFQHFRAQQTTIDEINAFEPPAPAEPVDMAKVKRLRRYFDAHVCLLRWPSKQGHQQSCLWVLWSRLPPKQKFSEAQINRLLQEGHAFGDHALLRRWLCDYGMVSRTVDGREYRRVERRPPAEALMLIHCLSKRPLAEATAETPALSSGNVAA